MFILRKHNLFQQEGNIYLYTCKCSFSNNMKFHRACVSNCKYKWSGKNSQINKYLSFIWSEPLKMIEKIDKLI